jgi:hypothetical protein
LRRFRLRRAAEVFFGNVRDFNARLIELSPQSFAARGRGELGRYQRATNRQAGAKQLFDRAYAFGDEKRVFLARFSSVQITRKCK